MKAKLKRYRHIMAHQTRMYAYMLANPGNWIYTEKRIFSA